jgi:hypothetical protein
MGAIRRLSADFDVYSEPGKGSVFLSRIRGRNSAPQTPGFSIGVAMRPVAGETVCGDAWAFRRGVNEFLFMLADGLGHGLSAADASGAAVTSFMHSAETAPVALVEALHRGLRGTRGAAVAVASVEPQSSRVRFSGLGNIAGVVAGPSKTQSMVSHNGTAGHEARRMSEFSYSWTPDSLLVMHSDGLSGAWSLDKFPGLIRRHPSVIAGVLYREAGRDRDDACVVVGRAG